MGLFDKIRTGFDRVELNDKTGKERLLKRSEFDALPLDQRVWAILNKKVRFYRGDQEITTKEALGER